MHGRSWYAVGLARSRLPNCPRSPTMQLLIDGYNVLFAAGAMPRRSGPGELARSREWLLQLLFRHLDANTLQATTIVFDAKDGPRHLAAEYRIRGVRVLFARDHDEADDLIETLIRQHASPKKLTVVTSDLRLREAARRRRSRVVPSDDWLDSIEEQEPTADFNARGCTGAGHDHRDLAPGADEVADWLHVFERAPQPGEPPQPTAHPRTTPSTDVSPKRV